MKKNGRLHAFYAKNDILALFWDDVIGGSRVWMGDVAVDGVVMWQRHGGRA